MLHPNIYTDGKVCISTLQTAKTEGKDAAHYWRPVLGIEQAILSVVSLLSDPNLDDPANTAAANLMRRNKSEFDKRCAKLAQESLKAVPKDFELPKMNHETVKESSTPTQDSRKETLSYDVDDLSTVGSKFTRGSQVRLDFSKQTIHKQV